MVQIPRYGTSITIYYTLTFSESLQLSVSTGYPDVTIPLSPPCTGRSHMYGDSRKVMIKIRSPVYTKVHPPPPVIGTG